MMPALARLQGRRLAINPRVFAGGAGPLVLVLELAHKGAFACSSFQITTGPRAHNSAAQADRVLGELQYFLCARFRALRGADVAL